MTSDQERLAVLRAVRDGAYPHGVANPDDVLQRLVLMQHVQTAWRNDDDGRLCRPVGKKLTPAGVAELERLEQLEAAAMKRIVCDWCGEIRPCLELMVSDVDDKWSETHVCTQCFWRARDVKSAIDRLAARNDAIERVTSDPQTACHGVVEVPNCCGGVDVVSYQIVPCEPIDIEDDPT